MRRHRPNIPPRRPIFLGCEGSSEVGYGTVLSKLAHNLPGVHVHIVVKNLQPGAGDPLQLVNRAIRLISDIERRRTRFTVKAILLDQGEAEKMKQAAFVAKTAGIDHLIWQAPDHEGLLLRHIAGCEHRRPPSGSSMSALRKEWPTYTKGMSAQALIERIGIDELKRASTVEAELRNFFHALGIW